MSKKKWFQKGSWAESLFPNSVAKHEQKIQERDEDGFYLDEDYSNYDYDFDRKLQNNERKGNKKDTYQGIKSDYAETYKTYEKTGVWRGYQKTQQLSYKYVQQMANALSVQHNIKVQVGNIWEVDLIKKTLTYNPASLIYGTKAELLATLMHEIGKLRYVTHSSLLKNNYLTKYKLPAMEVLSIYEDLRTDFLMLKAYESASEIYESIIPTIETQVKLYMQKGDYFRRKLVDAPRMIFENIKRDNYTNDQPAQFRQWFGTDNPDKIERSIQKMQKDVEEKGNIYEWCGEMLSKMYDLDEQGYKKYPNIEDKIARTLDTIEPSKKFTDSQSLVDYLDTTTYPIVEDLLKSNHDKSQEMADAFPDMSNDQLRKMMDQVKSHMGSEQGMAVNVGQKGNTKSRTSGQNDNRIPPEWTSGDYKTLKDSVSMEIKQLVSRPTFLRRDELTTRFEAGQKRGKLNSKTLYKSSLGSRRLFKKKLQNTDTIQSFAFSLLIDVSGSMDGNRIAHTTRAMIILAEVFKKMNIPFEIATFSNGAKHIKKFSQDMDKKIEMSIGGLPNHRGDGTNLNEGLDILKIHDQPERNKVVVVLTDGGVGSPSHFDDQYFIPWSKRNIKSVGFGVECEPQMKDLCMGNSKLLDNASALPVEFSNLLKGLIKRK